MTNTVLLSIRRELRCLEAELSAMQRFALGVEYNISEDVMTCNDKNLAPRIEDVKRVLRNGADDRLDVHMVYQMDAFASNSFSAYTFVTFRANLKQLVGRLMRNTYPGSKFQDASDSTGIQYNEIKCDIKHADQSTSTITILITASTRNTGIQDIQHVDFKFT
jgi:hypothetical protein